MKETWTRMYAVRAAAEQAKREEDEKWQVKMGRLIGKTETEMMARSDNEYTDAFRMG